MSATTDRIFDISEAACRVKAENGLLVIEIKDGGSRSVPFAEVGALVVSSSWTTFTQPALAGLMASGGQLVICDSTCKPAGMLLPIQGHSLIGQRLRMQVNAKEAIQRRLWSELVRAKIRAQAEVLRTLHGSDAGVEALAERVRPGDPANIEARAARVYWRRLFASSDFHRDSEDGAGTNALLNYGYAILRASVARALSGVGLNLTLGIHHHERSNAFSLADDVMEPYRPLVDGVVAGIVREDLAVAVSKENKSRLIRALLCRVRVRGEWRTVSDALRQLASGVCRVLEGGDLDSLVLPDSVVDLTWDG